MKGRAIEPVDKGLRGSPLKAPDKRRRRGSEQEVEKGAVGRDALSPQRPRRARKQLPRRDRPEAAGGVRRIGNQRRRHRLEPAAILGVEHGRPARAAHDQRIEQHVSSGIVKLLRVRPRRVVDDAALAPRPDLPEQVRDQRGPARSGRARHHDVMRFGARWKRRPGNPPHAAPQSRQGARHRVRRQQPQAPSQPARHAGMPPGDRQQDEADGGARADPRSEYGMFRGEMGQAFAGPFDHGIADYRRERSRIHRTFHPLVALVRPSRDADEQLGLRERAQPENAPLVGRRPAPQSDVGRRDGGHRNDGQSPDGNPLPRPEATAGGGSSRSGHSPR